MSEQDIFSLVPRPPGTLEKAAPGAKRILNGMVDDTLDLARKTAREEAGLTDTQLENWFRTGASFYFGRGVPQDYGEAMKWYRKAAEQGHAKAQNNLGDCYVYGDPESEAIVTDSDEVEIRFGKAVAWYRKAAKQGNADAQCSFGYCYAHGFGIPRDDSQAVVWFRKAAEQGNTGAQDLLADQFFRGDGVRQDYTEAVKWYRKAAQQGDAEAQNSLGDCYFEGLGVPQDNAQAVAWYCASAEQGHIMALSALTPESAAMRSLAAISGSDRLSPEAVLIRRAAKAVDDNYYLVQSSYDRHNEEYWHRKQPRRTPTYG